MYEFDQEIIHDKQAMWHLAVSFKNHYNFLKEQLQSCKKDNCILYNGNLLFKSRDKKLFEEVVKEYENDFIAIERVIAKDIRLHGDNQQHYIKYVHST